ncbi:biliverdin-producing heme oxygenase [Leucobacter sp.]
MTALSETLRRVSSGGHGGDSWTGSEQETPAEPQYYTAYLRGGLNREGIAAQAAHHYLMYEALEGATDAQLRRHGPGFAFAMPELRRLPALEQDLEHWIGADWEQQVRQRYATPGIREYTARIAETAHDSLPHFIAHHYTRYLADLSGGLMIAELFRTSYGIEGDDGVRFYVFDGIEDPRAYKDEYRRLLDETELTEDEKRTVAEEVALAYRLNNAAGADLESRFEEYRAA